MNVYREKGYESRKHFLQCLAEDYDLQIDLLVYTVDYKDVVILATTLGESEDFDGLVSVLEDYCGGWY